MEAAQICVSKTNQEVDCKLGKWEKKDEAEDSVDSYPIPRT
jgi:hypothetical protein